MIGRKQCLTMRLIIGKIPIKTPSIEADGEIIAQTIITGKIEINQAAQPIINEKHIIREQITMDDTLRQIPRPMLGDKLKFSRYLLR